MQLFKETTEFKDFLRSRIIKKTSLGFVPTMGALHEGHLSLIKKAAEQNETVICSIFVNPTQFNDPNDLANYPRTLDADIEKLKTTNCSIVFAPSAEEMYKNDTVDKIPEIGYAENIMEGAFRPGHFKGVVTIVKKLLEIVRPDSAYFGEKDFQQLSIIKDFVRKSNLPVKIIGCEIIRESDGLAMSSRNIRLTVEERIAAPIIYKTLSQINQRISYSTVSEMKKWVINEIESSPLLKVDYFEIIDSNTLNQISHWNSSKDIRACIAVKTSKIRLLDNIAIFS